MRAVMEKLETELRALEHELVVELPREIKTAVAMGDLRENAEYHAALDRQRYVKARIGQLRQRLGELSMMSLDRLPKDSVAMGSTVTLLDLDLEIEITYELVVPELSNHERGLISIASPIGRGLIGRKLGDKTVIVIPAGKKRFEILELRTMHDKEVEGAGS